MNQIPWDLNWSPSAIEDRDRIYDWNERYSARFASDIDDLIAEAAEQLRYYPNMGRNGRLKGTQERVITGGKYILVYYVDEQAERVEIATVVHTAQKFPL